MEPNYHPDALANYNYKFDQNSFMCYHIGAKLQMIFGWGYTNYTSIEQTPRLKNMKKFDFTKCRQYKELSTNILQTHEDAKRNDPHSSCYHIEVKNGNVNLTYEFD